MFPRPYVWKRHSAIFTVPYRYAGQPDSMWEGAAQGRGTRGRGPLEAISETGSENITAQLMDEGRTRENISVNTIIKQQGKRM